jgi:hypothetical protein
VHRRSEPMAIATAPPRRLAERPRPRGCSHMRDRLAASAGQIDRVLDQAALDRFDTLPAWNKCGTS